MSDKNGKIVMQGVREHAEGYPVELCWDSQEGRLVVRALNEGGYNVTLVDLLDLIGWLKDKRPDLLTVTRRHGIAHGREPFVAERIVDGVRIDPPNDDVEF